MFSAGKNIKQRDDKLMKIDIQKLYSAIKNPKPEIKDLLLQLRILISIDPALYKNMKTKLPYIVPSLFNPMFRKKENFGSSEHLILDFDHLSDYDIDPEELKNRLKKDSRVELIFISPSMNGLKVFFRLKKKCFDSAKYSLFYKQFSITFAKEYNINNVLDTVTSDVTRACFISFDEKAFLNTDTQMLEVEKYTDFDDIFLMKDTHKLMKEVSKEKKQIEKQTNIDSDVFNEIKGRLNPNLKVKIERKKNSFIPEELKKASLEIVNYIKTFDIEIKEVVNISYGKKFIVEYKLNTAEINVFYGKKGFSIVRSIKNGTNKELMEILYKIITDFFEKEMHMRVKKK